MGIQINGNTDTISAIDGGLNVSDASLGSASASSLNISGIVTASGGFSGNVTGNINSSGVSTFSGGLLVGTGSSISSPATNVLVLGTNNTERLRINSDGGIGIGTTTTNSRSLSITGATNSGTQVEIRVGGNVDSAGIAMISARQFEIQSTVSNETNYPSSFIVYDRNANGYRMVIDGSGRLQIPSQPGFFAAGTTGAANQPSTGDSDMLGTLFNTTTQAGGFNTGNHYNTSTGIFTAPVAGKYYTFFNMRWETGNFVQSSYIRIHISKNNNNNLFIHQINGANEAWANYMAMSCSGIIDLAAGDTLRPKGGLNAGTAVGLWNESSWGAWLLG